MALMDSRSSEALARMVSVWRSGATMKRSPLRRLGFLSAGVPRCKSRARSAASWSFLESRDS